MYNRRREEIPEQATDSAEVVKSEVLPYGWFPGMVW
jgi:hypothetical protein